MINLQTLGWPVERENFAISVLQIQESERQRQLHIELAEGRQHSQRGVLHSLRVQLLVLLLHPTPAHAALRAAPVPSRL